MIMPTQFYFLGLYRAQDTVAEGPAPYYAGLPRTVVKALVLEGTASYYHPDIWVIIFVFCPG